jgi:hypothetical protein
VWRSAKWIDGDAVLFGSGLLECGAIRSVSEASRVERSIARQALAPAIRGVSTALSVMRDAGERGSTGDVAVFRRRTKYRGDTGRSRSAALWRPGALLGRSELAIAVYRVPHAQDESGIVTSTSELACPRCGETRLLERGDGGGGGAWVYCAVCAYTFQPPPPPLDLLVRVVTRLERW